jgi:ATPase subunit of ABC transporter with duplicated ATPase domains
MLAFNELVAGYDSPIVGPVSLALTTGSIIGIAGTNGCGKSTLLKSLYGEARVFSGSIRKESGCLIACQQQRPVKPQRMPITTQEYLALMATVDTPLPEHLLPLAKKRIDSLSGGQYQMLNIFANLSSAANIVSLDEPTNNLDAHSVTLLKQWLLAGKKDKGFLLVSHDTPFLNEVCDEIINVRSNHHIFNKAT